MLKNLRKKISNYGLRKFGILGLTIQLVSLFRVYPSEHPCGRVINIVENMNVLINCDSAVYMKDAQQPSRLFNGESVYQDRPLPTLIVSALARSWHFFNLPDYYRDIIGNSGQVVKYSLVTYILFVLLSASIFSFTVFLGLKSFALLRHEQRINNKTFYVVPILFIVLISMNEITKTFFWTPGSQMFNLLLPVYLFYLIQFAGKKVPDKFYLINLVFFALMLFSYAFFVIVAIPLVLVNWKSFKIRFTLVSLAVTCYLLYPPLLNLIGGHYNYFALGYRRMYVWLVDAYFDNTFVSQLQANLSAFLETMPIIPCLILLVLLTIFTMIHDNLKYSFNILKPEIIILLTYLITISLYGYYSRRLTYPIVVFMFLILLKLFSSFNLMDKNFLVPLSVVPIILISVFSWLFTNGPLI